MTEAPAHPPRVARWLERNVIPLRTVEADGRFDDLEPVRKIVGDARIVSLGEATHGTREFFQMKHRMLEFLATEMGFTIFGIEASLPETLSINDWVLGRGGDPAPAQMRFWTWDTREVLEMIRWMRAYNTGVPEDRKLKFYGFDMQSPPMAVQFVVEYLDRVDPLEARRAEKSLAALSNDVNSGNYSEYPKRTQARVKTAIETLKQLMKDKRREYVRASDEASFWWAQTHLDVIKQGEELTSAPFEDGSNIRDRYMAANVSALLKREGPDSKVVLWAHNGHVQRRSQPKWRPMGYHLHRKYGEDMVVFGFAFGSGGFQAIDTNTGRLRKFKVKPTEDSTLDSLLSQAGDRFVLDCRKASQTVAVANHLGSGLMSRACGAVWNTKHPEWFSYPNKILDLYDAVIFIRETTAARGIVSRPRNPVAATRRAVRGRETGATELFQEVVAKRPVNIDMSKGRIGEAPSEWHSAGAISRRWYRMELSKLDDGGRALQIDSAEWPRSWGAGNLVQTFEAAEFVGRRITFSASIAAEAQEVGSGAQLFVWIRGAKTEGWFPMRKLLVTRDMFDRQVRTPDFQNHSVSCRVPRSAEVITIGCAFTGRGRARFSNVSFRAED